MNGYLQIFMYDGFLLVVLLGVAGFSIMTLPLLVRTLSNISSGYTHYFSPYMSDKEYKTALTTIQRLTNLFTFLRNGRIKYKDPNYSI